MTDDSAEAERSVEALLAAAGISPPRTRSSGWPGCTPACAGRSIDTTGYGATAGHGYQQLTSFHLDTAPNHAHNHV